MIGFSKRGMKRIRMKKRGNKLGQIHWNELLPWIIALAILALFAFAYFIGSGRASGIIGRILNLFRWGV